ncbi:MAG TPA: hypothetical protein VJ717_19535 [Gemmatimonadaceae bacterium]|nr:hypothetical protein [Gemmatimonadaceae bacterium]
MLSKNVRLGVIVLLLAMPLARGTAQSGDLDPQCTAGTTAQRATQDFCQKAIDTFQFLAPQLGISIVGGSATLGQGTALGGIGKFSVGLRANLIPGRVPRVDQVTPNPLGATRTTYEVEDRILGFPTVDAAAGVFPGIPMGPGGAKVLAVDIIANLAFVPDVTEENVSIVTPDGAVKFGFGGRLGLIQESGAAPGIGVSYLRRDLPRIDIEASVGNDRLAVRSIDVESQAWRVMLQKRVALVTVVVGAGRDHYETSALADVEVTVAGNVFTRSNIQARQDLNRDNIFADVALNLSVFKIAGELGYVRGGTIETYNGFGNSSADKAHAYGSLGIRLSF